MSFLTTLGNLGKTVGGGVVAGAAGLANDVLPGSPAAGVQQFGNNVANPNVNYLGNANPTQYSFGKVVSSPQGQSATNHSQPTANAGAPGTNAGPVQSSPAGGSASSYVDPTVAALLGGQISGVNNQIGALDSQLAAGKQNVTNGYNQALYGENLANEQATRDYNTAKQNDVQGVLTAKNNIDTGVRQNTNSLQRLLGLAGSGNSSAAEVLAPFAASRAGDIQRQGVQTNFGQNQQALDTSFGDTQQKHERTLGDLQTQEQNNNQSLENSISNTRASLLQSLAGLTGQQSQAAGKSSADIAASEQPLLAQIAQIVQNSAANGTQFSNPVYNTSPTAFTAPTTASYNVGSTGAPTASLPAGTNVSTTPYLAQLLGTKDKNGNTITG